MNIRIITDSTSDLPVATAEELGVTVVPAYIRFGNETFRDRIDISEDEFYSRLEASSVLPTTEPAPPEDFAAAYTSLAKKADAIISIHISSKLSATCNSARKGAELAQVSCPVEVIDSGLVTMALGLLVIEATRSAARSRSLSQVISEVKGTIPQIHILGYLDTLKYLVQGGRVSKAKALLGSMLSIKPLLTIKDGEIEPAGQVRSRENGIDALCDFVKNTENIQELALVYSTTPDEVGPLMERISTIVPAERIRTTRLGSVLGVHAGPSIMFVSLRNELMK